MFSLLRNWDMHSKKLVVLAICVVILSSLFVANTVSAEDEIENLVEATFNIEFITATELIINVTMDAQKLTVSPNTTYTSDQIKSLSEYYLGACAGKLSNMLQTQIYETFKNAEILNFDIPVFNGNTFNEELNVRLTSSFFELSNLVNADNFINGILDMSAIVNYTINFHGEPGWNNTYIVDLGANLNYQRTNGVTSGNKMVWTLKNWDGNTPDKTAEIQVNKTNPTTKTLGVEDIFRI